jgi:Cys-tRNA(Pro)/Cys-tRNA(Cys) deacylase
MEQLMSTVNNVTRLLDSHKVDYQAYDLPVEKIGAIEAAQLLHVPEAEVYKTIVVTRVDPALGGKGKKPVLAVVPGPASVDLKLLAACLSEKKMFLPTERQAEQLTGLQAGGISPLALINKGFQVVIDNSARQFERIHVSGGQRGLNIQLPVDALAELTHALFGNFARYD